MEVVAAVAVPSKSVQFVCFDGNIKKKKTSRLKPEPETLEDPAETSWSSTVTPSGCSATNGFQSHFGKKKKKTGVILKAKKREGQVSLKPVPAERSEQFRAEEATLWREVRREITNGRAADGNYRKGQGADGGAGQRRQRGVRGEV